MELDELKGIGPATKKKLNEAGVKTIMDLVVRGSVEISEITGMDKDAANKYCAIAREYLMDHDLILKDFSNGEDVLRRRRGITKISTGTESFDGLLGGGVESQAITEIYGAFGCGKTQFCHTLCVESIKQQGGKVLYIDTENTFRPERIESMAQAREMDPKETLRNIMVARAQDSSHQILILEKSTDLITENNIKLIVVDSLTGLFRAEYLGRGTLSERQQKLNHCIHLLSSIAEKYNCAAIVTNQVMASPDIMFGDPVRAIGGNVVAHTSTYRLYFRKSGKKRVAKMIDSPHHPDEEIMFSVDQSGVIDYEEKK